MSISVEVPWCKVVETVDHGRWSRGSKDRLLEDAESLTQRGHDCGLSLGYGGVWFMSKSNVLARSRIAVDSEQVQPEGVRSCPSLARVHLLTKAPQNLNSREALASAGSRIHFSGFHLVDGNMNTTTVCRILSAVRMHVAREDV